MIDLQTDEAMKTCYELFPYFDLINIQGAQPFTEVQKKELIEETLTVVQKIAIQKKAFYDALRSFDIKYPKGLTEATKETIKSIDATYPGDAEEGLNKRQNILETVEFLQGELNAAFNHNNNSKSGSKVQSLPIEQFFAKDD